MNDSTEIFPPRVIRIPYGDNEHQFGDLRLPDGVGPFPVAIVIHGGFWRAKYNLDHINPLADALTAQGIATWTVEYRRVGHEGGAWPGTFHDCARAADYVRMLAKSYPLDLTRVATIGHSAGGHLAVWLAARHKLPKDSELVEEAAEIEPLRLYGAVSLAGVCDLELMHKVHHIRGIMDHNDDNPTQALMGGTPGEYRNRYNEGSPIHLLPCDVPILVIHGALDIDVPLGISDHFVQQAEVSGDSVTYMKLPTSEHFNLIDPSSEEGQMVVEATVKWLLG